MVLLVLLLIGLAGSLFYNIQLTQSIRRLQPWLAPFFNGEALDGLDVIGEDGKSHWLAFQRGKTHLVFLFEQPCTQCNKNKTLWAKLDSLCEGQVDVFGILLTDMQTLVNVSRQGDFPFPVYVPSQIDYFRQQMRLRDPFARTVLVHNGRVIFSHCGDLGMAEFSGLLAQVKQIYREAMP